MSSGSSARLHNEQARAGSAVGSPVLAPAEASAVSLTDVTTLVTPRMPTQPLRALSPLRYPGSKRKLAPAIQALMDGSNLRPALFVEPFCGGSSIALRLLEAKTVERIVLADLDPMVAAFWWVCAYDSDWLIKAMRKESVTLERFDFWRQRRPTSVQQLALKCLFLNRTSFSGIMHGYAGPIGGRSQAGEYKIDCRFPKDALADRISNVAALAKSGEIAAVWRSDWETTLGQLSRVEDGSERERTLLYLDPPYIEKAARLYRTGFTQDSHRALADHLVADRQRKWILSYDDVESIRDMYQDRDGVRLFRPTHHYTTSGSRDRQMPGRELLFTNLSASPTNAPRT